MSLTPFVIQLRVDEIPRLKYKFPKKFRVGNAVNLFGAHLSTPVTFEELEHFTSHF